MAIKISDIPPEGLRLELGQKLDLFDEGTASTAFTAVLMIKSARGGIQVSGRVESEPLLECSRCLKSFPYKIDSEFSIDLAPVSSIATSGEHELNGGELDVEFYEGDEIEPADLVKEQMLISVPMVPLHSPDCKGLCPSCGTDLNIKACDCRREGEEGFGPFSALKDLFKK